MPSSVATRAGSLTVQVATRRPASRIARTSRLVEQRVLDVERDAAVPLGALAPVRRHLLGQPRARQLRHRLAGGGERVLGERRQQRRLRRRRAHSAFASSAIAAPVSRLAARRGLDLDVQQHVVGAAPARDGRERGQRLAGVRGRVPATRRRAARARATAARRRGRGRWSCARASRRAAGTRRRRPTAWRRTRSSGSRARSRGGTTRACSPARACPRRDARRGAGYGQVARSAIVSSACARRSSVSNTKTRAGSTCTPNVVPTSGCAPCGTRTIMVPPP